MQTKILKLLHSLPLVLLYCRCEHAKCKHREDHLWEWKSHVNMRNCHAGWSFAVQSGNCCCELLKKNCPDRALRLFQHSGGVLQSACLLILQKNTVVFCWDMFSRPSTTDRFNLKSYNSGVSAGVCGTVTLSEARAAVTQTQLTPLRHHECCWYKACFIFLLW